MARMTRAFGSHANDNEIFANRTRRAARRMMRRELHENGVLAWHGLVNGKERSRKRQSRRLVMMNQFTARDLAERSEYETRTGRILLEMHQMMTAIAPSSIATQQQATATPQQLLL
jgi:hypothetical protein